MLKRTINQNKNRIEMEIDTNTDMGMKLLHMVGDEMKYKWDSKKQVMWITNNRKQRLTSKYVMETVIAELCKEGNFEQASQIKFQ